jgi:hypothetical protein
MKTIVTTIFGQMGTCEPFDRAAIHPVARPAADHLAEVEFPELDQACTVFADALRRGVAL